MCIAMLRSAICLPNIPCITATELFNLSLIWLDYTVLHLCKLEYSQLVDVVLGLNLKFETQILSTFIILKIMNFILLFKFLMIMT